MWASLVNKTIHRTSFCHGNVKHPRKEHYLKKSTVIPLRKETTFKCSSSKYKRTHAIIVVRILDLLQARKTCNDFNLFMLETLTTSVLRGQHGASVQFHGMTKSSLSNLLSN